MGRRRLLLLVRACALSTTHRTTHTRTNCFTLPPFLSHSPIHLNSTPRYAYTGLVTSARLQTPTSTYVDLLGLTMLSQLGSVFWDGAWLLLLLVR